LDTHVVAGLFGGENHRLSAAAIARIQDEEVLVSAAVVLELQLLHEIKRVKAAAVKVIERLSAEIGLAVCQLPFASVSNMLSISRGYVIPLIGSSWLMPVLTTPRL